MVEKTFRHFHELEKFIANGISPLYDTVEANIKTLTIFNIILGSHMSENDIHNSDAPSLSLIHI